MMIKGLISVSQSCTGSVKPEFFLYSTLPLPQPNAGKGAIDMSNTVHVHRYGSRVRAHDPHMVSLCRVDGLHHIVYKILM